MRHLRRDLGVADRRRQPGLGELRRVVAVDQVVHDAGMLRLLLPLLVENVRRLALLGVGLVGRQCRRVQRQRVEHAGLAVLGIALVQLLHRLLVGDRTGAVIELVVVAVERADRRDVILFPLGLRPGGDRLVDRLQSGLQRRRAGREPQRVPVAHRDAPIAHRAAGLGLGDGGKGLDRLRVPERVQDPDRLIELLLRRGSAGNRKVDLTGRRSICRIRG